MPKAYRPAIIMAVSFLVAQFLALLIIPLYPEEYRAFGDPNNVMNPIYYVVMVLIMTAVMLLLAKKGLDRLIQYFMIASVWGTIVFVMYPVMYTLFPYIPYMLGFIDIPMILSVMLATVISGALYIKPEWYVIDIAGVIMGSGIIAVLGLSFGILPTIILLIVMAVYDFISVYRTKHMLDLADAVMETKLPIVMVAPKEKNYSFVDDTIKIKKEDRGGGVEREAMFMGLGDIIIPGILPASIFLNSGAEPNIAMGMAIFSIAGAFMGYLLLLHFVFKGKAQAGLPFLNTGAILAYIISSYLLTGNPLYGVVWWW